MNPAAPPRLPWIAGVLCAALLGWGIWAGSHENGDGVIYLQMAREMVGTGDVIDLHWMGEVAPQRPPLAIWLLAIAEAAAPGSLAAHRMPSVLMGALCLFLLFLLGRRLTGCDRTAALGVLLLLAANTFYRNARSPMTDTTALAGILAALYAGLRAPERPRWSVAAGAALGWVLMTKHALVAIPVAIMGADLLLERRWAALRSRGPWLGAAAALAVAGPWHLVQTLRHGAGFWGEYLGFNVAGRMAESLYVAEGGGGGGGGVGRGAAAGSRGAVPGGLVRPGLPAVPAQRDPSAALPAAGPGPGVHRCGAPPPSPPGPPPRRGGRGPRGADPVLPCQRLRSAPRGLHSGPAAVRRSDPHPRHAGPLGGGLQCLRAGALP